MSRTDAITIIAVLIIFKVLTTVGFAGIFPMMVIVGLCVCGCVVYIYGTHYLYNIYSEIKEIFIYAVIIAEQRFESKYGVLPNSVFYIISVVIIFIPSVGIFFLFRWLAH